MSDYPLDSIEELLAIALGAERKAAERYTALAERMRANGNDELNALFSRIAEEEQDHVKQIERLVAALDIQDLPDPPEINWRHPQVPDNRDLATNPNLSTPYIALAYAVNNEEQAFRYFSYVAANAKDERVRRFAEAFAKEELAHAALFRDQRRRAYHRQMPQSGKSTIPDPGEIHSLAELVAASIYIEQGIHDDLLAARFAGLDVAGDIEQSLSLIENLKQESTGGESTPEGVDDPVRHRAPDKPDSIDKLESARNLIAAAERAFLFYDNVTGAAPDEATMLRAQDLTQAAVDRINALHRLVVSVK